MRSRLLFAALCLLSCTSVHAQSSSNAVQLQLRIVPQSGSLSTAIVNETTSPPLTAVGQSRRFEVQYRLLDLNTSDSVVPAGLAGGRLVIASIGPVNVTLGRATLSRFEAQLAGADPPGSTDSSGEQTGTTAPPNQATGLHRPFRGGIAVGGSNPPAPNNDHPANGTLSSPFGVIMSGITPLSLSQTDQGNMNAGQDENSWYGLYSFILATISPGGAGDATLFADFTADPTSGIRFGFYNDGDPAPWTSSNSTSGTFVQVVSIPFPAPGTLIPFGMGGILALRRRR